MNVAIWLLMLVAAQNGVTIEGTAFNRITGAGVPNVIVTLAAASDPLKPLHVVTSDAAGAFRIEGVAIGDYVPSFNAPHGFMSPLRGDAACKPFHVAEDGKPVRLRVPVMPLVRLRGRVVDMDRRPVPRVRVELFVATGGGGDIGATDAEGRFLFEGVLPGAYKLRARPVLPGTPLARRSKDLSPLSENPPEGERWIWAPTYFPDASEIARAETIVVSGGADPVEYEIRLRSAPVYRLRGLVSDEAGKPATGIGLSLLSEIGWGTAEAGVTSGSDGSFEFPSVRTGEWYIVAESKRSNVILRAHTQMTMPNHDVENMIVRMTPPFTLDVLVEGIPGDVPAATSFAVVLESADGRHQVASQGRLLSDGVLQFEDVYPGRYRIAQFGPMPGYYLHSVLFGTYDATGRDFDLTAQSPRPRLIYKANPGRAQGKVENGAGVRVVFVETNQDEYVPGQDVLVATCDQDGFFSLEGIRPSTYHAFAFAIGGVNTDAVRHAVFFLGLSRLGHTIRLAEGETVTLDLRITPFPDWLQRP